MDTGYFSADRYDTPEKSNPSLLDRFLLNNRLYFIIKYAIVTLRSGAMARRGVYGDKEWAESSYYIFRFIEKCGGKFHLSGMDNIDKDSGPVLYIANHMGTLETMVLPCLISPLRRVTFVVKEGLVKHPLFKDIMLSRNPVVVGRSDPRKDFEEVMDKGLKLLKEGVSIIIFPQSTRSVTFVPEKFNSMGIKLAQKAGVKVVPVALKTDFWENGKVLKEIGRIDRDKEIFFKFGEPLNVKGPGKVENQKVIDFIQDALRKWSVGEKI